MRDLVAFSGLGNASVKWERHPHPGWAPPTERAIAVIGALADWHHLNSLQLAAHAGVSQARGSSVLRPLFEAGIVDHGRILTLFEGAGTLPFVWRLAFGRRLDDWLSRLDPEDRRRIHGGLPPVRPSGNHVYHDQLAYDIGRLMAGVPAISVVLGEEWASSSRLVRTVDTTYRGDLVALRHDGLRIVVEVTRTTPRVEEKVRRWALALLEPDAAGLVVCFLAAGSSDEASCRRRISRALEAGTEPARLGFPPPADLARVRSRLLVARWSDLVPLPEFIDAALPATRADGTAVSLAEVPLEVPDPAAWRSAVDRAKTLAGAITPERSQLYGANAYSALSQSDISI